MLVVESGEVGPHIDVGDAVRWLRVELDRRTVERHVVAQHVLETHGDIAELERRQDGDVLLGVLIRLQPHRILDDLCALGCGELGLDRGQALKLVVAPPLLELRVGDHGQERAVRVVEQLGTDQVLEESPFAPRDLEVFEVGVEVERAEGVTAIRVRRHDREHEPQRVGKAGVGTFAARELEVVDRGVDLARVHAVIGDALERFEDDALDPLRVFGLDALEARAEHRLLVVLVEAGPVGESRSDAGIDEGLAQRRAGVREQHLGEHVHGERAERVGARDGDPRRERLGLPRGVLALGEGIRLDRAARPVERDDVGDPGLDVGAFEARQGGALDHVERRFERQVAVGVEARVARVVMARVEFAQVLPREVRDLSRVASRFVRVGRARKQRRAHRLLHRGAGTRERALHLIEDDALPAQAALGVCGVLELEPDALLQERVPVEAGKESRVEIDVEKVAVVLRVACAERIDGSIRAREGVHERRERASRHAEKRIAYREALRAREDDVLEDVRDACRVHRRRGEADREAVVVVGAFDVDVPRAGLLMLELDVRGFEPFEGLSAGDRVAADGALGPQCHVNR